MILLEIARGAAVDDTVTCLVRGPASTYPRGYLWLIPIWFLLLSGAVALVSYIVGRSLPLWLAASEIGGLLVAACTAAGVLLTARRMAFLADTRGVLLGSSRKRKRPKFRQVYLPWSDISQVRLVPRRYGVLVELVLSPVAPPVYRPSLRSQAGLLLGALLMPIGVGRGRPALTTPRLRPPGYRVRLCQSEDDLGRALRAVAPETVQVRMLASMAALRMAGRLPRPPRVPRPPRPPEPLRTRRLGQYVPRRLPAAARRR
jgi:hypothetical protein